MAKPKNIEKTLKNLQPKTSLDQPIIKGGRSVGVALSGEDLEWLDSLPGARAEHIRKAIALYRQHLGEERDG